jgi:hypothetical protein
VEAWAVKAKIEVRTVGQSFGCESALKVGRKTVWTSRVFPFGFTAAAHSAATAEAAKRNLVLADEAQAAIDAAREADESE